MAQVFREAHFATERSYLSTLVFTMTEEDVHRYLESRFTEAG